MNNRLSSILHRDLLLLIPLLFRSSTAVYQVRTGIVSYSTDTTIGANAKISYT